MMDDYVKPTRRNPVNNTSHIVVAPPSVPQMPRNENGFFEYLKVNVLSPEEFMYMIKLVHLYTECVLTRHDIIVVSQALFKEREIHKTFVELLSARESNRRKSSLFYKPLSEINFSDCDRCTRSYIRIPKLFPVVLNTGVTPEIDSVLNKTFVSVPQGSEHFSFTNMRKNQYEEALFKCEEERFELDVTINTFDKCLKLLEQLRKEGDATVREAILEKIIRLKVVQKLYMGRYTEMIEYTRKNPAETARMIIERVKQKLEELRRLKNESGKKNWNETCEKNFHRSLDHRSFYFKQHDKKITNQKNYIQEAKQRFEQINKGAPIKEKLEDRSLLYKQVLNTFKDISSGLTLNKLFDDVDAFDDEEKKAPTAIKPIFKFVFDDNEIQRDVIALLHHSMQSHLGPSEKEKVFRLLKRIAFELLGFQNVSIEVDEALLKPQSLVARACKLESALYMKSITNSISISKGEDENKAITDLCKETVEKIVEGIDKNSQPATEMIQENSMHRDDGFAKVVLVNEQSSQSSENDERGGKNLNVEDDDSIEEVLKSEDDNESLREMTYLDDGRTSLFVPTAKDNTMFFYGTQNLYCFLRFLFTLYQRFLKSRDFASEFEENPKTALLSPEEKQVLSRERFELFKLVILSLQKGFIDSNKYEDLLRCIFGNGAYLLFTIEKNLNLAQKTLQALQNDELGMKILECFLKQNRHKGESSTAKKAYVNHEQVVLSRINHMAMEFNKKMRDANRIKDQSFFRFLYNPTTRVLYTTYYECPYSSFDASSITEVKKYVQGYSTSSVASNVYYPAFGPVVLKRNIEKVKRAREFSISSVHIANNIEYKFAPNTSRLICENVGEEDHVFSLLKKRKPDSVEFILHEYNKVRKFRMWHESMLNA
eukprot:TRINITY_DN5455_c0_g1_i1.p1 TRINITY_DN5455_c0_g1~~TRINITY_DN5455_c0_g1_i1.p1  ORF type:complete len:884 (+),score=251.19 TRINITY_DN5455_c0_g1_i1:221-2872(+)